MNFAGDDSVCIVGEQRTADSQLDAELQPLASGSGQPRLNAKLPSLEIRCPPDPVDPCRRHRLDPDCLPNTGRTRIPNRMGLQLPILLAARLRKIGWIVKRTNRDDDFVVLRERTEIHSEGGVPAFVD